MADRMLASRSPDLIENFTTSAFIICCSCHRILSSLFSKFGAILQLGALYESSRAHVTRVRSSGVEAKSMVQTLNNHMARLQIRSRFRPYPCKVGNLLYP